MKLVSPDEITPGNIYMEGVKDAKMKALITKDDGAPNFAMRHFELGKDGHTPYHKHPWEHEVYILEGKGELVTEEENLPLSPGKAVFVKGEEMHQFKNTGEGSFKFLCIVPNEGHK
jgi:quercetin dioxygenase-like cupin family protein